MNEEINGMNPAVWRAALSESQYVDSVIVRPLIDEIERLRKAAAGPWQVGEAPRDGTVILAKCWDGAVWALRWDVRAVMWVDGRGQGGFSGDPSDWAPVHLPEEAESNA